MANRWQKYYSGYGESAGLDIDAEYPVMFGSRNGFDLLVYPPKVSAPRALVATVSVQRAAGPLSAAEIKQFRHGRKACNGLTHQGRLATLSIRNGVKPEDLNTLLEDFTQFLQQAGFENVCQTCGAAGATEGCFAGGRYLHLCPNCLAGMQQQAAKPAKPENPVAGAVGALIGSLAGAVCIILLSQLGYVAALSGLVMGVCAIKGYEMLGGRLSGKGAAISVVIMLIMTYVADRLDWAIIAMQDLGVDLFTGFRIIPLLLEEQAIEGSVYWGNLVMLYLFLLLGMVPTVMAGLRSSREAGVIRPLQGSGPQL